MKLYFLIVLVVTIIKQCDSVDKRALQKAHEKPSWQKWSESFLGKAMVDQQAYLVKLLKTITYDYLSECTPVILYDTFTELYDNLLLEKLLTNFPFAYIHGQITDEYEIKVKNTLNKKGQSSCVSYMLFMKDVMRSRDVIGEQNYNRVIVVARSSQWRVIEFLSHRESQNFVNLLVIVKSGQIVPQNEESPYILYTHKLYVDALGSSKPDVITTWMKGRFTRDVNLFPKKMVYGFSGHRFVVAVAHQPPFIINKGRNENGDNVYEGIELRLLEMLAKKFNFTTDYRDVSEAETLGGMKLKSEPHCIIYSPITYSNQVSFGSSGEAVAQMVQRRKANLGLGGIYITQDRIDRVGVSQWHSQDCAVFISLTSTALPRYRAIMGPFHWSVWLAVTTVYLLAIFPLTFSFKLSLKELITNPEEMENMFWYVFGTFTNCFTFSGTNSWSKSDKQTTRILIGFYWLFTIIVTACYTGSIIAFVTVPIYPAVIDNVRQLLDGRYQIGTLDKGGWPHLFANSSDADTERLLHHMDLVPDVESGLRNITKSFIWNYAFLGSKAQLDYIVRTNFSTRSKRSILHITEECLAPFNIGIGYPKNSIYSEILDVGILLALQAGILNKLKADVEWDMMRTASGKLLAANSKIGGIKALSYEDRALNLDDTQGMFLLLAAGFVAGGSVLVSEWLGGCFKCFKSKKRNDSTSSIESNPRSHEGQTPREKLNSIQYVRMRNRLGSTIDLEQNFDCEVSRVRRLFSNKQEVSVQNHVNCVVHETASSHSHEENKDSDDDDDDFNEEINKIFENVFGEKNVDSDNSQEETVEEKDVLEITKEEACDKQNSIEVVP